MKYTEKEIEEAMTELRESTLDYIDAQNKELGARSVVQAAHKRVGLAMGKVREITGY